MDPLAAGGQRVQGCRLCRPHVRRGCFSVSAARVPPPLMPFSLFCYEYSYQSAKKREALGTSGCVRGTHPKISVTPEGTWGTSGLKTAGAQGASGSLIRDTGDTQGHSCKNGPCGRFLCLRGSPGNASLERIQCGKAALSQKRLQCGGI